MPTVEPLDRNAVLGGVLIALSENCERLREACYWAGASAMSLEELHHRGSFDLDFHTRKALLDVRPILAEIQRAFPGSFELISVPDEFGSGFKGVLRLPEMEGVTVEVLWLWRLTAQRFLADKIQCIAERSEARDLVDIAAVLRYHPQLTDEARQIVRSQDALILIERLVAWTVASMREDLAAYQDVEAGAALQARDLLLGWLREGSKP